jgi:recombinational DNA repair protein (RecF pathway)
LTTQKPTEPATITTRSGRIIRAPTRFRFIQSNYSITYAYRSNLADLLADPSREDSVMQSIYEEIDNILKPDVMTPLKDTDIPAEYLRDVINM